MSDSSSDEEDQDSYRTLQFPIAFDIDEAIPKEENFHEALCRNKKPDILFALSFKMIVEENYLFLDRDPDDPDHHKKMVEIFLEFKSSREAEFVHGQTWRLDWEKGPTDFKLDWPCITAENRAKYREIGEKVEHLAELDTLLRDIGFYTPYESSSQVYLPSCCIEEEEFDAQMKCYEDMRAKAIQQNDHEKSAHFHYCMAKLATEKVKVEKRKITITGTHIINQRKDLIIELSKYTQSKTFFTYHRTFKNKRSRYMPH